MSSKKIILFFLSLIFILTYENAYACTLTNLTSCSISDLTKFVSDMLSFREEDKKTSCSDIYIPVCSKGGKTYDNICLLQEKKDKLAYLGSCLEYPYNLSANECVKGKFNWDGYKCVKNNTSFNYTNNELGINLLLPGN